MEITAESMIRLPDSELLETYRKSRRLFAEKKFARDTERGRIAWQGARFFVTSKGGVTERQMALEASEDFAKKNQQIREMTLDLDLLKADIDVLAMALRVRGALGPGQADLRALEMPETAGLSGSFAIS